MNESDARGWVRSLFGLTLATLVVLFVAAGAPPEKRWFKGNTHTHTLWSDGDGAPEAAVQWYRQHGYQFLVLSDHNIIAEVEKWFPVGTGKTDRLTPERLEKLTEQFPGKVEVREKDGKREMRLKRLDELRSAFEEEGKFLLVKGEEITDQFEKKPVHHGLVNNASLIKPPGGKSVKEVLERTVKAAEDEAAASGRPVFLHLNHPNFGWGVTAEELAEVVGERYFEVYNGHRGVRNYGDATHVSCEKIWDIVLTARLGRLGGPPLRALATDDAHHYHKEPAISNPGRGWIMVRAEALSADALVRAMQAGDFYASSGVTLEDFGSDGKTYTLRIAAQPGVTYTTRFIGTRAKGDAFGEPGVILQESTGDSATYAYKGDELYVRATVVSSRLHPNGYSAGDQESAWAQPVAVKVPGK